MHQAQPKRAPFQPATLRLQRSASDTTEGGAAAGSDSGDMVLVGEMAAQSPMPSQWKRFLAARLRERFGAGATVVLEVDWAGTSGEGDRPALRHSASGAIGGLSAGSLEEATCLRDGGLQRLVEGIGRRAWHGRLAQIDTDAVERRLAGAVRLDGVSIGLGVCLVRGEAGLGFGAREESRLRGILEALAPLLRARLAFAERVRSLTPRGVDVLACAMRGNSEKEIADELHVTRHTVHQYMKKIYTAFGVGARAELLASAIPRGLQGGG